MLVKNNSTQFRESDPVDTKNGWDSEVWLHACTYQFGTKTHNIFLVSCSIPDDHIDPRRSVLIITGRVWDRYIAMGLTA